MSEEKKTESRNIKMKKKKSFGKTKRFYRALNHPEKKQDCKSCLGLPEVDCRNL